MEEYKFSTYWKNEKTSDIYVSADRKKLFIIDNTMMRY